MLLRDNWGTGVPTLFRSPIGDWERGPEDTGPSMRAVLWLVIVCLLAVFALGAMLLGKHIVSPRPGDVQFPPSEWTSKPPAWID
jgi:hypothetical protein